MTTYKDIIAGLHACFVSVPGLSDATVLDYEPQAIHRSPTLYTLLDSWRDEGQMQVAARRYRIQHRLCIKLQDNERAEQELLAFIDTIPASVRANMTLGGRLTAGRALITEAEAGYARIGDADFRIVDFYSDVLAK